MIKYIINEKQIFKHNKLIYIYKCIEREFHINSHKYFPHFLEIGDQIQGGEGNDSAS